MSLQRGILPLAKSTVLAESTFSPQKLRRYSWALPGHGTSYHDCGKLLIFGCLNVEEHVQEGLFENMSGKVFVQMRKRTCLRAECPICYEKWAGKEAGKIEHRLAAWSGRRKVIHVVASPKKHRRVPFERLRAQCYRVLRKSGVLGGSVIFHPFRQRKRTKEWYLSPHFHVLGYGWIVKTKEGYKEHGWVVKNVGTRKTVSGTALYQLSHSGIHKKYHSVTWFGHLSYNKLKVAPRPKPEKERCPMCNQELRRLYYFGSEELPSEEGSYWMDPEGFVEKPRYWNGG